MPNFIMSFLHGALQDTENIGKGLAQLPVQASENYSNFFANLGNKLGGGKDQTIQQNMGGGQALDKTLDFSGATGTNAQLLGDVAQVGTMAAGGAIAGPVGELGGEVAAPIAERAGSEFLSKAITGAAKGAAEGAAVNAPLGAEQAAGNKQNPVMGFLQGAQAGAEFGGVLGGVAGGVQAHQPLNETGGLNNATSKIFSSDELSQLAKSDNPTAIQKILEPKVGPVLSADIKSAIASTNDVHTVSGVIDNALAAKAPLPEPTTPVPTDTANPSPAPTEPSTPPLVGNDVTPQEGGEVKPFMNTPDQPRVMSTVMQEGEKNLPPDYNTPGTQPRGFTETVNQSDQVSPEAKAGVQSAYTPKANDELVANSGQLLNQGLDKATEHVQGSLDTEAGKINDQDVSDALTVAKAHDTQGNFQQATNIYQQLANHLTEAGRTIQAAALLAKRTPEGLQYWATKTLQKAKVPIEGDLADNLKSAFDALKQTPEDSPERKAAAEDVQRIVGSNLPSTTGEKIFGVWRAGLLTSGQILPKVGVSHLAQGIAETASNTIAAGIDKFVSNFGFSTGGRSLTATGRGLLGGAKEGVQKAGQLVKTGVDNGLGANSQADFGKTINYGDSIPGKFLNAYVNGVGRLHGAIYKPFAEARFANSLYDQALAQVKNQGLKGEEADRFVTDFVHSPSDEAQAIAEHDAKMFSFQQNTKLGEIATTIQNKGGPLGKIIAPFTKIPSAIATDLFNYSPAGGMKTLVDGIKAAKSEDGWSLADQRNFSQGLGRSIVGTAALVPGIMLYNRGMMTLGYPTDPKQQQLWQDEGKVPNAVLIGGQWRNLASLGPMGNVLSMGGGIADSLVQGKDIGTALINGFTTGAQSISQASYLQGSNQLVNTINDPSRNATTFVKSLAGSIVPAGVNSLATATDPSQRQTTGDTLGQSAANSIESRIPGLRENLAAKTDAFGNPLLSGETGAEKAFDPFNSSTAATPSPLLNELRRLQNAGFGEMPAVISKKTNFGTSKQPEYANLTRQQITQLTSLIGQMTESLWGQAVQDPNYQNQSDDAKQAELKSLYSEAAQQGRNVFAQQYQLGPYSPNVLQTIQQSKQKRKQVV